MKRPNDGRRLPVGAEMCPGGGVRFRVWAASRREVEVVLERPPGAAARPGAPSTSSTAVSLAAEKGGYFSGVVPEAGAGTQYRFRLDGEDKLYPDPASRFQPDGPHGPSQVIDPSTFRWTDAEWPGPSLDDLVLYEMHVGTFTREGTWAAAAAQLEELRALGITCIEMMPIADYNGRFGWGYDGVDLYAPCRLYGEPDDLRRFIDRAHAVGLAVILDVVYNHLGPSGNYLTQYSPDYFTSKYKTDWGEPLNYDGERSGPVREYFIENAGYWIDEFHFDGLRLDAIDQIYDASDDHIITAVVRRAREAGREGKKMVFVGENEAQRACLLRKPEHGGHGLDALWNDDFHHSATVALTGHNRAYYTDYFGTARELLSAVKWGYLYQGQRYRWQDQRRGRPALDIPPGAFVTFLENHDQVANSGTGEHMHALSAPGRWRAMTALLLLGPGTPMLFQGQEFSASSPFFYFADHEPDLARLVQKGRIEFLAQFDNLKGPDMVARIPDPCDLATFERCKLDFEQRRTHAAAYALHRDLLRLRRSDPVLPGSRRRGGFDGAVLEDQALMLRFFDRPLLSGDAAGTTAADDRRPGGPGARDRVLIVNLGRDLRCPSLPEPLLAPPEDAEWEILWSSEDPRYGGVGTPPVETEKGFHIPGEAAVLLAPTRRAT